MNHRSTLVAAGLFGASGVGLGAVAAHRLETFLAERGMTHAWETAARYHLFHALALLAVATWLQTATGARAGRARWAARCWSAGILLFSGSLYLFAVGGPHALVYVTPFGGIALIAGWLCLVGAALAKDP
ncbi:MAG: DUF423 domain-containing protein [Opitutus sp.]|nr:DUF423 domain-containing protein [Opitutus sp.]